MTDLKVLDLVLCYTLVMKVRSLWPRNCFAMHVLHRKVQCQLCELTLWDDKGLANSHSCVDEPASSSFCPVFIFFNESKEDLTCTMQARYLKTMKWVILLLLPMCVLANSLYQSRLLSAGRGISACTQTALQAKLFIGYTPQHRVPAVYDADTPRYSQHATFDMSFYCTCLVS